MRENALFCDGTSEYVIPAEPAAFEKIHLKFRTAKDDVDEVYLVTDGREYSMKKECSKGIFDYYDIEWELGENMFSYYFRIRSKDEILYYHRCGVSKNVVEYYNFKIMPGFSTPDWAKGAVIYQIFVDRFCNGDSSNDVLDSEYMYIGEPVQKSKSWDELPHAMDIRRFHGGDLQGVLDKLDYLQDLGVEVIYFNPLFVSPSNHKYDIQDYDYIDPHYGVIVEDEGALVSQETDFENAKATRYQRRVGSLRNLEESNKLFIRLIEEMHRRGMKVILDGVFNHCGSFNKWLDRERIYENLSEYQKGAYVSADSPYRDFFHFRDQSDASWPYNPSYDGWWGHDTLPKLNYEDSPKLVKYIMDIGKKWVSPPFCADGWRLDVAADLGYSTEYNHMFWREFRKQVKEANPEAIILAEHYGDPAEWLQGDEWDSIMNYDAFMEPLTWFLTGMEKHSDERRTDLWGNADNFVNTMNHFMSSMLTPSLQTAMNELSNHDHSRFLTRTNHIVGRIATVGSKAASEGINVAVMREAVAIQMTWVGAPTVYYGDEVGLCGFTDPDSRRAFPWGNEDWEMHQFHKDMIRIHKTEKPLRTGSIKMLYWENNVIAYARFQEGEQIIVVLNNSKDFKQVVVPVWQAEVPMEGKMKRLLYSWEKGYTTKKDIYHVENGEVVMNMSRHSVVIMKPTADTRNVYFED
ncbi:MAG: glycoside hydrolase family 13 protein [Candidatus Ruminococcus intestinipullorum]|nr:glycoside hydrolase family 13 protein [Candidatus Ruminococcus intestinipullorum]